MGSVVATRRLYDSVFTKSCSILMTLSKPGCTTRFLGPGAAETRKHLYSRWTVSMSPRVDRTFLIRERLSQYLRSNLVFPEYSSCPSSFLLLSPFLKHCCNTSNAPKKQGDQTTPESLPCFTALSASKIYHPTEPGFRLCSITLRQCAPHSNIDTRPSSIRRIIIVSCPDARVFPAQATITRHVERLSHVAEPIEPCQTC